MEIHVAYAQGNSIEIHVAYCKGLVIPSNTEDQPFPRNIMVH